ncbi:MAG: DPP IV N-terminal domain-containing protein, partial [Planctomycetota bacterium]
FVGASNRVEKAETNVQADADQDDGRDYHMNGDIDTPPHDERAQKEGDHADHAWAEANAEAPEASGQSSEAQPVMRVVEATEAEEAPQKSRRQQIAEQVFPSSYSAQRREGMTASERFDLFGDLPSSTATGAATNTGFDDTENLAQVTFANEGRNFDPAISPDGERVFFASTRHSPTADIYVKSVRGTAVTKLTNSAAHDVMPSLSPDGERVAFASNRNGSYDIFITNASGGGQASQVTSDAAHELHPTWSADGQTIAYCRLGQTSDRWEIWIADATNPGRQTFLTYGLFPDWHPTEDRILFQRSRDRGDRYFSVWTVDYVDGEAVSPTEIASSSTAAVINPAWSADGSYIAFSTILNPADVEAGSPEVADLWISRADGSQRANITGGYFANLMPAWSPEGSVFFISDRSGDDNIWSVRVVRAIQAASVNQPMVNPATIAETETAAPEAGIANAPVDP